jgi:hypothetical protein
VKDGVQFAVRIEVVGVPSHGSRCVVTLGSLECALGERLIGKVANITGGGIGIGAATVIAMAREVLLPRFHSATDY